MTYYKPISVPAGLPCHVEKTKMAG